MITVLVDGRNVMRSRWPNMRETELVDRCRAWARAKDVRCVIAFDGFTPVVQNDERLSVVGTGSESADDWLAHEAASLGAQRARYWLVTSDRELQDRAGAGAERAIGGGSFLRQLEAV